MEVGDGLGTHIFLAKLWQIVHALPLVCVCVRAGMNKREIERELGLL